MVAAAVGGSEAVPPGRRARLDAARWREILLFLGLLFCYGFFQQTPSWNEYSRYDLVRAVVEDGTTRIDRYQANTGDKALYGGHYYSDKAPGTAIMGVPIYAVVVAASAAAGAGTPEQEDAVQALAFVESGLLTALLVVLLLRFLRPAVGEPWALAMAAGYGLGSIAFPFATMFFGHAASAFFLFAAFYLLWGSRRDPRAWRPLAAGFLAGSAVITEMPVVLGVAVLGAYALWLGRRQAGLFVLGGAPLALVLAGYDWLTFGGPFNLGYQYATVFGAQNQQGLVSILWPSPAKAVDLLVGPRGLLRLAPWFALAPLGLFAWRRRDLRPEVAVCVAIVVAFLVYNSGAINPFGGWTPGPRYLLPALPFAAILVALVPDRLRPLVTALVAVAVVLVGIATVTMPNAPEGYADPLTDLWLPRLLSGDLAETGTWLRWGAGPAAVLTVLILGAGLAGAAIVAAFLSGRVARALVPMSAAVLVVLILAVSFPFVPWSNVAVDASSARTGPPIAITDVGQTRTVSDRKPAVSLWARMEDRGGALSDTRVVFTVYLPSGAQTWSAWAPDIAWRPGERRRFAVAWDTSKVAPGDYPFAVRVVAQGADGTVYGEKAPAGVVHVGP